MKHFSPTKEHRHQLQHSYRVSHSEVYKVNQLWGVGGSIILLNYGALWLQKVKKIVFHQPAFKKMTLAGLNSLWQKRYQISVKNWIFDVPFHKKGLVLVIWVLGMIKPSGSVDLLMKRGCRGHWGCWGHWGHWGCRGLEAWKITTEDFRVIQAFEFSFIFMFWKNLFLGRIMKYNIEFWQLFCWRLLRPVNVTFLKTGC